MGIEIGIGAIITAAISSAASIGASMLVAALTPKPEAINNKRSVDPRVLESRYGVMIPEGEGTVQIAGQVIWATKPESHTKIVQRGRGGKRAQPEVTDEYFTRSFQVLVCKAPPGGVVGIRRLLADTTVLYDSQLMGERNAPLTGAAGVHIYTGTDTQMPNTWIEADKGVGRVSAHRGFCHIVIKDLDLTPFGDRIPNIRVELVISEAPLLADAVRRRCARSGMPNTRINTTNLAAVTITGYLVTDRAPVRSSLESLAQRYQFDGTECDGQIAFISRPQVPAVVVGTDEIGWHEEDEDEPPTLDITRTQGLEIPRGVDLVYFDSTNYEEGKRGFTRQIYANTSRATINLPFVMDGVEASRLAKIIAVTNWTERMPAQFSLPPKYLRYAPGTVLTVPTSDGDTYDVRITRMEFAAPGEVRVEGVTQYAEAYVQTGDGAPVSPAAYTQTVEAEASGNTRGNGASIVSASGASSGSAVSFPSIGSSLTVAGFVIPVAGDYRLTMRYLRAGGSSLLMKTGETFVPITFSTSGGNNTPAEVTRTVSLPAGATEIIFLRALPIIDAPLLDRISIAAIVPEDDEYHPPGRGRLPVPDDTDVWIDSRPAVRDGERSIPRYYVAVAPAGREGATEWQGSNIARDLDGAGNYQPVAAVTTPATLGYATSALPLIAGLDTTSTLDVALTSGDYEAITDEAFSRTETINLVAVNGETLQFRDVLELADGQLRISHFKRGLRGTSPAAHAAGSRVVLLDAAVQTVDVNEGEIGETFDFYPVTVGQDLADVAPVAFTIGEASAGPGAASVDGDIAGTTDAVEVRALRGYPIDDSAPADGQALIYDGTGYTPKTISGELLPTTSSATSAPTGYTRTRVNVAESKLEIEIGGVWKSVTLT